MKSSQYHGWQRCMLMVIFEVIQQFIVERSSHCSVIMKGTHACAQERCVWHAGNPGLCGQIPGGLQVVRAAPGGAALPLASLDKQCPASALAEAGSTASGSAAPAGAIAGGVVGGVVLLGLAAGAAYAGCMLARRRRRHRQHDQALHMVSHRHSSMDGKVGPPACPEGQCMNHASYCTLHYVCPWAARACLSISPGMSMSKDGSFSCCLHTSSSS